jgi:hypothetical protein
MGSPFLSVLLTCTSKLLNSPFAPVSGVHTPLPLDPTYVSKYYPPVIVWTYDYSLSGRHSQDLVKYAKNKRRNKNETIMLKHCDL